MERKKDLQKLKIRDQTGLEVRNQLLSEVFNLEASANVIWVHTMK